MDVAAASGNRNSVELRELLSETQLFGYSVYFRVLLDTPLLLPTYSECPFVVKMLFLLFQSFPEYFYRYHCGAKKGNSAVAKQHLVIHLQNTHLNNIHLQ